MKCFTKLMKGADCKRKPYGKLRDNQNHKWFVYCRSCFLFQSKKNADLWDKKKLKTEGDK